ncbi:glycerol-3-phosphate 1-O-acyltransferase PlsY [Kozakia baliensis]|uniref:glycerol-3-phosphate 1-O-acyltransferase PlsY n=1 Tax=Kozakia baliensis TaxID=153496 RepID=UPI00087CA2B9|nr:glycerol-3-phosphate 1-O-acyltransferase PlsY [Kozakia baliensis]AOX20565.1 glycerol-3-phosphate acyltransferase [Kozakia baliensis]
MSWSFFPPSLPVVGVGAYLIGSVPFGLLLSKMGGAGDIRKIGSGNIGATNVLRTGRRGLAAATLFLDGFKGALAVLLARVLCETGVQSAIGVAAVAVVVGHCFPVWLGFRGGKGVATGLGALLALCWPVGLACCLIWLAVAKLSHISSAGALAAFIAAPFLMPPLSMQPLHSPLPIATLLLTLLIVVRHAGNIARLISGRESRINIDPPPQDKVKI